jgi:hypothetical protein
MVVGMITMNFASGLPRGKKGIDAIWVIVDRLTKFALFLPIKMTDLVNKLARIYINEVGWLHRILVSIVSNRDPRFTSCLWPNIQHALGSRLDMSIVFHLQIDGQWEKIIQIFFSKTCTQVNQISSNRFSHLINF